MREHCFARRLDVTVGQKGANAYSVHPQNDIYCCCLSVNNEHQYQLLVFILLRSIYVQRGELCAWYVCTYVAFRRVICTYMALRRVVESWGGGVRRRHHTRTSCARRTGVEVDAISTQWARSAHREREEHHQFIASSPRECTLCTDCTLYATCTLLVAAAVLYQVRYCCHQFKSF